MRHFSDFNYLVHIRQQCTEDAKTNHSRPHSWANYICRKTYGERAYYRIGRIAVDREKYKKDQQHIWLNLSGCNGNHVD